MIPVRRIWPDGIFLVGNKFSKTYKFSDINYLVASREDKESMFLTYSELLNSLDSGAVTKITINNRRMNQANFETSILMPMQGDFRDEYRGEYNQMLLDKATGANGIMQEKYITISVVKKDIEEARAYFSRVGADLISHFAALGSKCVELDATERLRILHDFYRQGEESEIVFNAREMMKRGHSFKDYICPDGNEKKSDYLKLGGATDEEKLENLIAAIDELKAKIGIKKTIRDYGIDETDFLTRLDSMVEQAFDDQCTGANPRYPLMSEIKQMYLNAYYGTDETK